MNKPYKSSNEIEAMVFEEKFCNKCKFFQTNNCYCDIWLRANFYDLNELEYPSEWIYDSFGYPVCTKFIEEK